MIVFRPLFSKSVFDHLQVLLIGAILTPGARTVANCLRLTGFDGDLHYQNYHRVLNRATWSVPNAGRYLLHLLIDSFATQDQPLVFGLDDTIERRRGDKIKAKGIYRDPVRSSRGHFVKASGLRWLCMMFLCPVPWAGCIWALPFMTVLCPSERYYKERGRSHNKLTDRARQMIFQLSRWLPDRALIVVCDSSFAAIEFLDSVRTHATVITRLRLDAALYEPARPRQKGKPGRTAKKGKKVAKLEARLVDEKTSWIRMLVSQWYGRSDYLLDVTSGTAVWYHAGMPAVPIRWVLVRDPQGKLDPKAFLSTNLALSPLEILTYFVRRWRVEVTFEEVRRHLGVETQRQWNDLAIARTTPCLMGLFSLVTLFAHCYQDQLSVRQAAWYQKQALTFSDALAAVRIRLWKEMYLSMSGSKTETLKIPKPLFERLTGALAYAA